MFLVIKGNAIEILNGGSIQKLKKIELLMGRGIRSMHYADSTEVPHAKPPWPPADPSRFTFASFECFADV